MDKLTSLVELFTNDKAKNIVERFLLDDAYTCSYIKPFELTDVYDLRYAKISDNCSYCGYGKSIYVLFKINNSFYDNKYCVIKNWCGCLTYDPSYTFKTFETFDDLEKATLSDLD